MASLDWSQCPAVESIPGKVSGAWVFKGTRTPVAVVFENLEDGITIDEMQQFPVTREQVKAVLEFAARSLDAPASRRQAARMATGDYLNVPGPISIPIGRTSSTGRPDRRACSRHESASGASNSQNECLPSAVR